jgi:hypothetical protein
MKTKLKTVLMAIGAVLIVFGLAAGYAIGAFLYRTRTIDRVYASVDEMGDDPRTRHVKRFLPKAATNIHFISKARFGEHTDRFSCQVPEADFICFAKERSYIIATNSFTALDFAHYDQEDREYVRWRNAQMDSSDNVQRRHVFGDASAPRRFFSITESHAFDGGAVGGNYLGIIVFDRDAGMLTGYDWGNCL